MLYNYITQLLIFAVSMTTLTVILMLPAQTLTIFLAMNAGVILDFVGMDIHAPVSLCKHSLLIFSKFFNSVPLIALCFLLDKLPVFQISVNFGVC